jgi:rare lipoprotein A
MIRRHTASLFVASLMAADALWIGAAGLRPQASPSHSVAIVPIEPLPRASAATAAIAPPTRKKQTGVASWYGARWQGRTMASGEPFDDRKLTAAHRTLPLNSHVRVTNLETGRAVEVTIKDRGPYVPGRVIDLSEAAAKKLGMVENGLAPVRIETRS